MLEAFSSLENNINDRRYTNLKHLMKHYKDNWIQGKNWSAKDICVYKEKIRTNNDAEKFHNNLNYKIQKTNVDFYELLGHLGEEAKWLNFQVRSLISDKLSPLKTKKQKNFEELLKENWEKLDNSHLTAIQFLHEINNMKYQDELINENWSLNFSRIDLEPEEEDLEEEQFQEHEAELSF